MLRTMHKLKSAKQRLLDRFSRDLDALESRTPMTGSYERIDPYLVDHSSGGHEFEIIVYHRESEAWYGGGGGDHSLDLYRQHAFVRPGDVAFDVGCNAGLIAVWLGLQVGPEGRVLAFDPFPWNALATHYNCRLNFVDNVTTLAGGLSDRTTDIRLPLATARTLEKIDPAIPALDGRLVDVLAFVDEHPTFAKIDIEGGEFELSRADWSRFTRLERIFLELHPWFIEDRGLETRDVLRRYASAGYSLRYGHPLAAPADAETVEPAHGGWWLTREQSA